MPLRDVVIFPHVVMPLLVGRAASLAALDTAAADDSLVLLVAQKRADTEEPGSTDLYRVGVLARILQISRLQNGTTRVLVESLARAKVTRYAMAGSHLKANVQPYPMDAAALSEDEERQARRAISVFEEYVALHRRLPDEIVRLISSAESHEQQACLMAAHLNVKLAVRQKLLDAPTLGMLFEQLTMTLSAELELLRLERKIEDDVRGALFQNQREFYLQEQLRAIHRELGNEDGDDVMELETQLVAAKLPDAVLTRARREVRKLRRMAPLSPEATVSRTFLDWVLALPFHARTEDTLDVAHAKAVLDIDHYGLEDVKDRILDYIAVLKQVGKMQGPILCLVGPPGVGKTSLARSIAGALGRKFVRMSLGGVRDEAEIRGHRRTYIGAMPGRIIQAMRRAESMNPVLLLDEIDKLGNDWRGDPSAALLEVLDPEQNSTFNDHYLEIDYDLSQVLFVTTANSLSGIPEPLRDRMEIIRLSGYLDQEKLAIATQYLVPRTLKAVGIEPSSVTWEPEALRTICRGWTREAGVRDFERRLARVARKLARLRAEAPVTKKAPAPLVVRTKELTTLLGAMQFDPDETSLEDKVGVAAGLAFTTVGGETLEIEVSVVEGRGRLQLTGTLGDVMKESASAAMSYARQRAGQLGIAPDFYKTKDIHIHIPAGATPKDGPSAGIAIATAVISALTGIPVRGDIAMTGEITLRGRVLPIGGVKEKSVGAHRAGISHVLLPKGNARDLDDVPQEVRDAITFHTVGSMDEVLALGLRMPNAPLTVVTPASTVAGSHAVPSVPVQPRRERGSRRAPVHPN